jgi:hypothetical protein
MSESVKVMGWPVIIALMVATAVVTGLVVGLLRDAIGWSAGTAGVGVATGVVGAILIARRRAALAARPPSR